jgi:MFS family permease
MALPQFLRPPARLTLADRRILTVMVVAGMASGYAASLLTHTFPFTRESMGLTEGEMSLVVGITRAGSLLAILFSFVGDRRGRRTPFLIAFALVPLANLGTALVPRTLGFVVFQSLTRIGAVAVTALAIVILAEELSPRVRAYGLGVYPLGGALGGGLSLILLPIADRDDGWRILFALSALSLLAFPLLLRYLRETRAFNPTSRRPPITTVLHGGHARYLWPLAGAAFFVAMFSSPAINLALERLIDDLGWSTSDARLLVMVAAGLGTLGLIAGGRLADTAGRRPTELIALLIGLVGGVMFYNSSTAWVLGPGAFLAVFGASAFTPAIMAHRSELFPTPLRATAGAWINNAAIIGSISAFMIGGFAIDQWGLSATVTTFGIGVIVAGFLLLPLPETRGRDLVTGRPGRIPAPESEASSGASTTSSE